MIKINGRAPEPRVNTAAVTAAIMAPPPVLMVPPIPEAEPAKCGLTDIMPAFAFGITIPFPNPIMQTQPKNDIGIGLVNRNKKRHIVIEKAVIIAPIKAILSTPNDLENLPDRPLPIM